MEKFNSLDIETYDNKGKFVPYCICLILDDEKIIFYGDDVVKKLLNFFNKKKIKKTIYVHNLTFDGSIIIENMDSISVKMKGILYRSSIYELLIWNKNFKIVLKCSYKLMPLSLEKISKMLIKGSEKLYFPHKFANKENIYYEGKHPVLEVENWNFREECIKYCIRDCTIVLKMLEIINSEIKKNKESVLDKSRSISGLALNVFKENFNPLNLETKIRIEDDDLVRKAYFGGRCEIFGNKKKEEKAFHFDFTGMYSEIMGEELLFGNIKVINNINNIEKEGFYNVEILSKDMYIPVLPYRTKIEKKLIFPNGRWTGTYWHEELKEFNKEGGIILKINYLIEFEKKGYVFRDFINYHKILRKKSEFDNTFWKLFINSVYGRLGMGMIDEKTEITTNMKQYNKLKETKTIIKESIINEVIIVTYEDITEKKHIESNVSIAAQITSKARIKLYKGYKDVIKNGGRILYSDTDSIFASFERDVSDEKHGEIFWDSSKNDTIIEDCVFAIPKGYAIKYKNEELVKIKGFKRNSITFSEFKETFNNGGEIISNETNFKKSNYILKFEEIEKIIKLNSYDKRIFSKDKKETIALDITE